MEIRRARSNFERASWIALGLGCCGIEAWRPFTNATHHIIAQVGTGVLSMIVGCLLGMEIWTWALGLAVEQVKSTERLLLLEEEAHEEETEAHEETIRLLRALINPDSPMDEAREYLSQLDLVRYEPDDEEDPSPSEEEVH